MIEPNLLAQIAATVRAVARIPSNVPIHDGSRLIEDLGVDSLDLFSIVVEVQDRFGVVIDVEDMPGLARVSDLAEFVARRIPTSAAA
jgi:acyl carrier protein